MGDLSGALLVVPLVLAWIAPRAEDGDDVERRSRSRCSSHSSVRRRRSPSATPVRGPTTRRCVPDDSAAGLGLAPFRAPVRVARHRDNRRRIATWSTVRGSGPFATTSENTALLILATFIATLTATMLPMAAVVTERRRAEAERARLLDREHAARVSAEATSSAKDDFLAMLGHELRNPLSAIATAAHVLSLDRSRDDVGEPRPARDQSPGQASGAARGRSARRDARHHRESDAGARAGGRQRAGRPLHRFTGAVSHARAAAIGSAARRRRSIRGCG